jgi:hypothetical protein
LTPKLRCRHQKISQWARFRKPIKLTKQSLTNPLSSMNCLQQET